MLDNLFGKNGFFLIIKIFIYYYFSKFCLNFYKSVKKMFSLFLILKNYCIRKFKKILLLFKYSIICIYFSNFYKQLRNVFRSFFTSGFLKNLRLFPEKTPFFEKYLDDNLKTFPKKYSYY